jgi:H+-translocating NAD(P) transhydrogenase subunit alpha
VTILASTLTTNLAILVLAGFVGFIVISRIPNTLHTPLMSGTNAIHGIVLLGGLLLLGLSGLSAFSEALLVIAVAFGTINIVGGFLVTDRMLEMFKRKPGQGAGPSAKDAAAAPAASTPKSSGAAPAASAGEPAARIPAASSGESSPGSSAASAGDTSGDAVSASRAASDEHQAS